ncbi:M48 family metalloprotease [Streptomyces pinistramenti]|uniref:M48 family metalloprotease n=1 Tax=Streptomyces pinistramenti TaxID=2884812 RepID=UPI001D0867E2|nr:M48 family metalloprotease [Streptomyces pinistramenti]MCB5909255.1 M48 family metalloprotease [Streptomyces pinistramenti]
MTTRRAPGLDIRAFPSDLALLLGLLAATVLTGDLFFSLWLATLEAPMDCPIGQFTHCPRDALAVFTGTCKHLMVVLVPGLTAYQFVAWRRIQRSTPLTEAPFSAGTEAIRRLVQEAGLWREPTVMVDPALRAGAYVTGRIGGLPRLMLGPELLALSGKDAASRRIFEAVVRHELAHLHGTDLQSYAVMTALRWSNLYAGLFTTFTWTLQPDELGGAPTLVRILLVVLLGELIARAYLRFREHHADLHAGLADREGLVAALRAAHSGTAVKLRSWLRHHPMGSERLDVLEVPGRILASSPGVVFLGATTAGVLLATFQDMLMRFYGPRDKLFTPFLCGMLVGMGLTVFLAFTLWRHHWYAGTTTVVRTVSTAVLAAAGIVVGTWVAVYTRGSGEGISGFPLAPSALAALVGGMLLLCGWLTLLGSLWYRVDPYAERIPRFLRAAVPAACVVGGWLFVVLWTWAVALRGVLLSCSGPEFTCLSPAPERDVAASVVRIFGPGPVMTTVVLVAWGVPLVLWSRHRLGPSAKARADLRE